MFNFLKTSVIKLTDAINAVYPGPFQPFTRPAIPKYPQKLCDKAALYERRMLDSFLIDGKIFNYRIPTDGSIDLGDQSLWHGVYTFMWAASLENASDSRLAIMANLTDGLARLQKDGKLVRGVSSNPNTVRWDTSNDQASGYLLGLYGAARWGGPAVRAQVGNLVYNWAFYIWHNNHCLTNADDTPTTYGKLINGPLTDPLRLTLCLAIYRMAIGITGHAFLRAAYEDLLRKYEPLIPYAKVQVNVPLKHVTVGQNYDTHRAAIHLMVLHEVSTEHDVQWFCAQGLMRIREMTRNDGNVWVNALCASVLGPHPEDRDIALKVLSEFTIEDGSQNNERINSTDSPFDKVWWNDQWCSRQPLPRWKCSGQDFFWQRDLHAMDKHGGADSQYCDAGYLPAYWLSRRVGILNEND